VFIEQFWLRRDPTPGTSQNEMRDEHYRRIAYVSDHFGYSVYPGWRSDRGAIYIKFGPPDELESHAAGDYTRTTEQGGGTVRTYPFEQWHYRFIQGLGPDVLMEFVDVQGTGEYPMSKDPRAKEVPGTTPQTVPAPAPRAEAPKPIVASGLPSPASSTEVAARP